MIVRIRITSWPQTGIPRVGAPKVAGELAAGLASLLTLVSVVCFTITAWKIMSEMGWAGSFFITTGVFSHWQVWIAAAVAAQLVSFWLSRPGPLVS